MEPVVIRHAEVDDASQMVQLGEAFYNTTRFCAVAPFDPKAALVTMLTLIKSQNVIMLVAELESNIVGGIAISLQPMPFSSSGRIAQELFWYVAPGYRSTKAGLSLLVRAEEECRKNGATFFVMAAFIGTHTLPEFYRNRGFIENESSFVKVL